MSQYVADDGNFRRRSGALPIAIVIGILAAGGAAAAIYFGVRSETTKVTQEDIAKRQAEIGLLPMSEQLPKWRELAKPGNDPRLQQEAFAHLAWAKDKDGLQLIIDGLSSPDKNVVGTAAAALYDYGSPAADAAKPALLAALKNADEATRPQICYALAVLHEPSAFDTVLAEYKKGTLAPLQRLDGRPAFDPVEMSKMVPLDKFAQLAGDEVEAVRVLVAKVLSETADAKWLDVLTKLVQDKALNVSRQAAVGLGKIATPQSMQPLLDALTRADKESRAQFLTALRDGIGGQGLALALKTVQKGGDPQNEKNQYRNIFEMLRELADPRAGDGLVDFINTNPPPHWKTEAAFRLAEVGDVRAAPTLAWRLTQNNTKIYNQVDFPEMLRNDDERSTAARLLADLAAIHPEKKDDLRKTGEDAVFTWFNDNLLPNGNGMRFLAAVGSQGGFKKLRDWADPDTDLPKKTAANKDFDTPFKIAPSALRYLGVYKDPSTWSILTKQLDRRPKDFNASMDALMAGNQGSMLGLVVGVLGKGAADGMNEWGDNKGFPLLVAHLEEPKNADQSRGAACIAVPWVASDDQMKTVVQKVHDNNKNNDGNAIYLQKCYLEALVRRPVPDANAGLLDMLTTSTDSDVRHQIARALGMGGLTRNQVDAMMEKLKDPALRYDAALALMLGADADTVSRAFATFNAANAAGDAGAAATESTMGTLKELYNDSFDYWSATAYDSGNLARWVENATALQHVKVNDVLQDWPTTILSRNLVEGLAIDNGPHSITRVQLRAKLLADARGTNEVKRTNAIMILRFMKEQGALMALKAEGGPGAELARQQLFDLLNPKLTGDKLPDAPKAADLKPPSAAGANVNVVK